MLLLEGDHLQLAADDYLLMMTATKVMMAAMGMLAALVMVPPLMVAALVMLVEVGW